jgi:AcrR family transcriptional regulator
MYICLSGAVRFNNFAYARFLIVRSSAASRYIDRYSRSSLDGAGMMDDAPIRSREAAVAASTTQAERSERTRAALLSAAEAVFARDGFEASRIEDIAAEAGRSRGAFYANFVNKTEVFLALRSIAMRRRAGEVRDLFERFPEPAARDRAILHSIAKQLCDTPSLLLQIEFKLFALRHPEMLADLSERHLEASTVIHRETLKDCSTSAGRRDASHYHGD